MSKADNLMMRLFLDFALTSALKNRDLERYTLEMSKKARNLIDGVVLEDEANLSMVDRVEE